MSPSSSASIKNPQLEVDYGTDTFVDDDAEEDEDVDTVDVVDNDKESLSVPQLVMNGKLILFLTGCFFLIFLGEDVNESISLHWFNVKGFSTFLPLEDEAVIIFFTVSDDEMCWCCSTKEARWKHRCVLEYICPHNFLLVEDWDTLMLENSPLRHNGVDWDEADENFIVTCGEDLFFWIDLLAAWNDLVIIVFG